MASAGEKAFRGGEKKEKFSCSQFVHNIILGLASSEVGSFDSFQLHGLGLVEHQTYSGHKNDGSVSCPYRGELVCSSWQDNESILSLQGFKKSFCVASL